MKKPLLVLTTLLGLASCGVTEVTAPGRAHPTAVALVAEDSAAAAFADSLATSTPAHTRRLHIRRGPAVLHKN